ncbi:MAG: adenine deaminase [Chloroflexota bacterium]|nr:MAG: adenine deaminase [Chloroflexota bacterium]
MDILRPTVEELADLIEVAQGRRPADLVIRGGTVVNVYSGELLPANVAVCGRRIAYVGPREDLIGPRTTILDATGRLLTPGYIEPHGHPSMLYNPCSLAKAILPRGTTTFVSDNLYFYFSLGVEQFRRFASEQTCMPLKMLWAARTSTQSLRADEDELFAAEKVRQVLASPHVVELAEITRWPPVLAGERSMLEKIVAARRSGRRVDGHTAGCSYDKLVGLAAAGIDACHESIDANQALERLRLGMYVMLRHGSLRQDLPELLKLLRRCGVDLQRIMLTVDGSSAPFIADHGTADYLLTIAQAEDIDPIAALRMVTLNPATYFRLDQELGAIAPGRIADILFLRRLDQPRPEVVLANGQIVARDGELVIDLPEPDWDSYPFPNPRVPPGWRAKPEWFQVPAFPEWPEFPVIDYVSAVIPRRVDMRLPERNGFLDVSAAEGVLNISLLDRHGRWVTNGLVRGFARDIQGFACSFSASMEILVIGRDGPAMAAAVERVFEMGGGIVLLENGESIFELPLEIAGMMTRAPFEQVVDRTRELYRLLEVRGHPYHELLYTLAFIPCDLLPGPHLTYKGLLDVRSGEILYPRRELV